MADDKTERAGESAHPAAPAPQTRQLGNYTLTREIARGGMGVVFEAEDLKLHRRVALKVVREGDADPEFIARLHREATIAAQLRHPNIVVIHEVGSAQDVAGQLVHFIAMDYVEGCTLADVQQRKETSRADMLRMYTDVARAVAYAHERGVVHRDLKPQNVLVGTGGHVFLSDFGLARADSIRTQLTQSQSVMGTPMYMAPEQVEGRTREISARTDVYALGVMLFEILCSRPPFTDLIPAHLFWQIVHDEPPRPADLGATVARDLEVICMKALEKDPLQRYASAAALADDVDRFRRGEPILAQPPSLVYRLRKTIVRRKRMLAVTGITLVFAVAAVAALLAERGRGLNELRKRTQTSLDAALALRRAGSVEGMQRFATETEDACREAIERKPRLAEPHYLLGRMQRALMKDDEALAAQERALALDADFAPALYERVVLTTRLYRWRVEELVQSRWGEEGHILVRQERQGARRIPSLPELAKEDAQAQTLRLRIDADLKRIDELVTNGDSRIGAGELACVRGLLAYARGDAATARDQLGSAIRIAPTLEEAYESLASLELDGAGYEASVEWFTRGLEKDRGYIGHIEGRAQARMLWTIDLRRRSEDASKRIDETIDDATQALQRDPNRTRARFCRGIALIYRIEAKVTRRGYTPGLYVDALADFAELSRQKPDDPDGWIWHGACTMAEGYAHYVRGEDPRATARTAIADLDRATALAPSLDLPFLFRGICHGVMSLYAVTRKEDPAQPSGEAIADLDRALALNANRAETWMWRGLARAALAGYAATRGQDPLPNYDAAMKDLDKSVELEPGKPEVWTWRGQTRATWALYQAIQLKNPIATYELAILDFDRALQINASHVHALRSRGNAHEMIGITHQVLKRDATESFTRAIADYEAVIGIDPELEPGVRGQLANCKRRLEKK